MPATYADVAKRRSRYPWWVSLCNARQRCNDPKHNSFPKYGARGLRCELSASEARSLWERDRGADMKRPSLDRINPDRGYSVDNCRFLPLSQNSSAPKRFD